MENSDGNGVAEYGFFKVYEPAGGLNLKAKCIDNRYGNTNFKLGKIYDYDINGIATEWGGIRVRSKIEPTNSEFNIGLCKFKVIKEGR